MLRWCMIYSQRVVFSRFGYDDHCGIRARYADESKQLDVGSFFLVPFTKELDSRFMCEIWDLFWGKMSDTLAGSR